MKLLRTIGFDRRWARAQGAYLWDDEGNRYLDLLGGFGMFNVGRNNPRVREALVEALELERPGSVQLGVDALPGAAGRGAAAPSACRRVEQGALHELRRRRRSRRRSSSAAPRRGRSRVLSAEHGFHGLTLGALSANGEPEFTERFGPLLPGFERVPWNDLEALERELAREDVALFVRRAGAGQGRQPAGRRLPRGRAGALPPLRDALLRRRGADRASAARAACSRSSTGASSPT